MISFVIVYENCICNEIIKMWTAVMLFHTHVQSTELFWKQNQVNCVYFITEMIKNFHYLHY